MSHSYNKTTNNKKINKKPYCKVCHDFGKPESVYTSHYVKSHSNQNVTVTCPTLKEITCRSCNKLGHTTKFCPINQKNANSGKVTDSIVIKKEILVDRKVNNAFDILSNESDDEDTKPVEDFPVLKFKAQLKPIITITESKKWCDIIKDNRKWTEYNDSDSDEDDDKYHFKPIHAVAITINKTNRAVKFDNEDW